MRLSLDPVAEQVQSNSQALETLISTVGRLDNQLSSFITSSSSSGGMVDCANSTEVHSSSYATVASTILPAASAGASNSTSLSVCQDISPRQPLQSLGGRESNLVIFGLPESGSIVDDKVIVDEAFKFLVDKSIEIKDMFCLGKYNKPTGLSSSVRARPLLVKVSIAWDRKLVLLRKSTCRLRDFRISRLFLREDVPPEHKLRQRRSKLTASHGSVIATGALLRTEPITTLTLASEHSVSSPPCDHFSSPPAHMISSPVASLASSIPPGSPAPSLMHSGQFTSPPHLEHSPGSSSSSKIVHDDRITDGST